MTTKFRPSIISYAGLSDAKMIVNELLEDLANELDAQTYEQVAKVLEAKKGELDERYKR